jgi:hypothetical protein
MAKKRKTRQEKRIADLRHTFVNQTIVNTFESKLPTVKIERTQPVSYASYPYLIKDLSKTITLTAAIIGTQIILFFILRSHLIKIPGLSY